MYEITTSEILCADPCYGEFNPIYMHKINLSPGLYQPVIKHTIDNRISSMTIFKAHYRISELIEELLHPGVSVDSGQFGFFETSKIPIENSFEWDVFYDTCCGLTNNGFNGGVFESGVVCSSGYGDGCYPLYGLYTDEQKLIGLKIIFITDLQGEDDAN